jgi:hypothetical protein
MPSVFAKASRFYLAWHNELSLHGQICIGFASIYWPAIRTHILSWFWSERPGLQIRYLPELMTLLAGVSVECHG